MYVQYNSEVLSSKFYPNSGILRLLLIKLADPNKATFNKGPILCTPGNTSKFLGKLGVNDPNTPMTIGINLIHLRFHIFCSSKHTSTYFKIFSHSLSTMFISAGIATSIRTAERSKLLWTTISGLWAEIIRSVHYYYKNNLKN